MNNAKETLDAQRESAVNSPVLQEIYGSDLCRDLFAHDAKERSDRYDLWTFLNAQPCSTEAVYQPDYARSLEKRLFDFIETHPHITVREAGRLFFNSRLSDRLDDIIKDDNKLINLSDPASRVNKELVRQKIQALRNITFIYDLQIGLMGTGDVLSAPNFAVQQNKVNAGLA